MSAIVSEARRGTTALTVEQAGNLRTGEWVQVEMTDNAEKTLLSHLYSGDPGSVSQITRPVTICFASRVAAVRGGHVELERPLRWDVRSEWSPVLKTFEPSVSEVGIEHLAISFPVKPYKGRNLSFDHHKRCPCENLFCNVDVGDGGQVWRCGGGGDLGRNCGARGTFWGILRSKQDIRYPEARFAPASINIVGVKTSGRSVLEPGGRWHETIPPETLDPADLHAAHLARRLRKAPVAPAR